MRKQVGVTAIERPQQNWSQPYYPYYYGGYRSDYGGYRPDYYGGFHDPYGGYRPTRPDYYGGYRPDLYGGGYRPTGIRPDAGPPTLSFGQGGPWVVYLQGKLGVPVTGVVDVRTTAAVRSVQVQSGLAPTGVVDTPTWTAILPLPHQTVDPIDYYSDPYAGLYFAAPFLGRSGGGGMMMTSSRDSVPGRGGR